MKALVLHDNAGQQAKIAGELMGKGFQVVALGSVAAAREWLTQDMVDVLVTDECVSSQLTHSIALSAERRNPYVSTVMLTERSGEEAEELYLLIPSLYSLLGRQTTPAMIARLAMASVVNVAETEERVRSRKRWLAAQGDEEAAGDEDFRPAQDIADDIEQKIEATNMRPVYADQSGTAAVTGASVDIVQDQPLSVRVPGFFSRSLEPAAGAAPASPLPGTDAAQTYSPLRHLQDWGQSGQAQAQAQAQAQSQVQSQLQIQIPVPPPAPVATPRRLHLG